MKSQHFSASVSKAGYKSWCCIFIFAPPQPSVIDSTTPRGHVLVINSSFHNLTLTTVRPVFQLGDKKDFFYLTSMFIMFEIS